jgi:hypothetical protein
MNFKACFDTNRNILMEGALGERLKREYGLTFDDCVAMAGLIYDEKGASALSALWGEYIEIARRNQLPFLATTPTRRANRDRIDSSHFPRKSLQTMCHFSETSKKTVESRCMSAV